MEREVPGNCPICQSKIKVSEVRCKECKTVIKGEFELCKFCRLSENQKYFLEAFIKNRGNIKEIEKDLGISYPTVRNKLDEVISVLGYQADKPVIDKKAILEKLKNGEISKDEALNLLKS